MKISELKEKVINLKGPKVWDYIVSSDAYKIYTASEEEQLKAVQQDEYNIIYINNPTEKVQLEAVREIITSIRYIKNPTDKVIEEVVKKIKNNEEGIYLFILKYIENDLAKEEANNEIK